MSSLLEAVRIERKIGILSDEPIYGLVNDSIFGHGRILKRQARTFAALRYKLGFNV